MACGDKRVRENGEAIRTMTGPQFRIWRRNTAASVGGVLLDDLPESLARAIVDYLTSAARESNVTAA